MIKIGQTTPKYWNRVIRYTFCVEETNVGCSYMSENETVKFTTNEFFTHDRVAGNQTDFLLVLETEDV